MGDASRPLQDESSEDAWRLSLLNAVLGLLFFADAIAALLSTLLPTPRLDLLVFCLVGYTGLAGVAWRARGLPLSVRVALVVLPTLPVAHVLMTRGGFLPGIPVALSMAGALTAVWVGPRAAAFFIALCTANFFLVGYGIATKHLAVETALTDPHRLSNWIRLGMNFCVLSGVLAFCMHWVVRRVEKNAHDRGAAHELLRRLNRRLENAKEDERRHLARELHDELGQSLTALKLQLKLGARLATEESAAKLEDATQIVDELIRQVRALSVNLSPPLLQEAGLVAAVRAFVENSAALSTRAVELELSVGGRFSPEVETTAFRVIQESITNILRHADAKRIWVKLREERDTLQVAVRDDGRGFDVTALLHGAHFGLVGMRERVSGIGGLFTIESRPHQGTTVNASLPRNALPY